MQVFRRVTLPLSAPGLALAGELGLVRGLGAFLGPLLLGGPPETTLSVEVHRQAFEYGHWPRAAAGASLLIAAVGGCLAAYAVALARGKAVPPPAPRASGRAHGVSTTFMHSSCLSRNI